MAGSYPTKKTTVVINKLCPSDVEYKQLGDLVSITTGKLNANAMSESGLYPFFTCAEQPLKADTYAFDCEAILISGNGRQVGNINHYIGKFNAHQRTYVLSDFKETIAAKFLFYYLKMALKPYILANKKHGSVNYITLPMLQKFLIPVPPIKVQDEIVRILDNLTELTKTLTNELTTELTARKKQYEYYMNELLTFDNQSNVKWLTVGDLFEFKTGLNKGKEFFGKGVPIVNYSDVYKNKFIYSSTLKGRVDITKQEIERYSVKAGDVFFTRTSEFPNEVGFTSVLLEDVENCVFSAFVLRARPITKMLLPKYCSYIFSSHNIRKYIVRYCTYTTRALTNGTILSKILLPVPSIEEQERIIAILDRFNNLYNETNKNLQAEIEFRKKQYEYYRNKLLTFNPF